MKKSFLFGTLAFFAISAMSVQNVQAQDNTKKNAATTAAPTQKPEKPVLATDSQNCEAAPKACEGKKCSGHQCGAKKAEPKSCCDASKKAEQKSCCDATKNDKAKILVKPESKSKEDDKKACKSEK